MISAIISCFMLLTLFLTPEVRAGGPEIMQAQVYDQSMDVSGWLMSEKLDGVRGYWDGNRLLSKNGIMFHPPPDFLKNFPDFPIEGELWGGRGTFEKTISIIKKKNNQQGWQNLKFAIFDAPEVAGVFSERLQAVRSWFIDHPSRYAFVITHTTIQNSTQLDENLKRIESLGGEGIILRKPDSRYTKGRSRDILKVKSHEDAEAVVIAHLAGAGRNQGRMGSLLVELPTSSIRFKIGSGFTDAMRENPPAIGALITFKHYGYYKSGTPKFPSYLRVRADQGL